MWRDSSQGISAAAYYSGWSQDPGSVKPDYTYSAQQQQKPEISDDFFSSLSNHSYQTRGFKQSQCLSFLLSIDGTVLSVADVPIVVVAITLRFK
ncbi:hypothetical protein YC2023_034408 [Brassica napus]